MIIIRLCITWMALSREPPGLGLGRGMDARVPNVCSAYLSLQRVDGVKNAHNSIDDL